MVTASTEKHRDIVAAKVTTNTVQDYLESLAALHRSYK